MSELPTVMYPRFSLTHEIINGELGPIKCRSSPYKLRALPCDLIEINIRTTALLYAFLLLLFCSL